MQYSPTGLFNDKTLLSVRFELNVYIMLIYFILKGVEHENNCVQDVKADFDISRVEPFRYMYYQNAS
jgi:hypothetical protein